MGAAEAAIRREGRVLGSAGAGGLAAGVAARRETFQGAAGVIRPRPTLRRVSSAMLASDVVVSDGEVDKR